jgi:signal transduction histidine kinase
VSTLVNWRDTLDPVPGTGSSATPWERMFLECDRQGHVLWMNERARARLGPVESLFTALPAPHLPAANQMLQSSLPANHRVLVSTFLSANRRIPVLLVRLLALEHRVVLSAEVRSRATDARPQRHEALAVLLRWQSNATRNYFRLLRAHQILMALSRSSRSTGAVVMDALEMERTRIARELHSGAGQTLAGIKVNVELIERRVPDLPEPVRIGLGRIQSLADQALGEIRSVSQRLHPPDWQRLDLLEAMEWLWITSGIPEMFHATLELRPLESEIPDAVRFTIYRAAQEALTNVLRHSGATEVKLRLGEQGHRIHLVMQDNGKGFDVEELLHGALNPNLRGIGLRAMRNEVVLLGGEFQLTSSGDGTRLAIALPVAEDQ